MIQPVIPGRLTAKLLVLYLGSVLAASVVTVAVLIYLVQARETHAVGNELKSDAVSIANAVNAPGVEDYLRRLGGPQQQTVLWGRFDDQMRGLRFDESHIRHLHTQVQLPEYDALTSILVRDSAESAQQQLLMDRLEKAAVDLRRAIPTWIAVNVIRSRVVYCAARRDAENLAVSGPAEETDPAEAAMVQTSQDGLPRSMGPFRTTRDSWISGFAPVRAANGEILGVVEVSNQVDAVLEGQRNAVRDLVFEALATLVLGGAIGALAMRPLSRRLARLQGAIDSVRTGRLDVELPQDSADEVGALAAAFNAMARELREKDRMRAVLVQTMSREVAQEMLSGKPELEGAEREATVLFTDVRGFTTLSEGMSAHNVIGLLNDYFEKMAPPVEKFGGVVDKFIGDGMLAMFGAPHRIENDALAAVRAAVAMREGLQVLNTRRVAEGKPPLEIGIGINTGSVVTGTLGSKDRRNFTVLGQTVNVASRLCSAARPGQIVISQSTWLRVKSRVEARELPPLELKGVTFRVTAFEVLELLEQSRG